MKGCKTVDRNTRSNCRKGKSAAEEALNVSTKRFAGESCFGRTRKTRIVYFAISGAAGGPNAVSFCVKGSEGACDSKY